MHRRAVRPSICPVCGESVPPRALACPGCGADERTGWNTGAGATDGLDLPDEDFDYDAFLRRTFGNPKSGAPRLWWVVALLLVILLLAPLLFRLLRS